MGFLGGKGTFSFLMEDMVPALLLGFVIDFFIGDPKWLFHPVRGIGWLISHLERGLFREEDSDRRKLFKGGGLWLLVLLITGLAGGLFLFLIGRLPRPIGLILRSVMAAYMIAAKDLKVAARAVYRPLIDKDIRGAREAVSMIVGRDTDKLDAKAVCRAAVESVAESSSDGVIGPLFYMALGGPLAGLLYKAINTMDSMLGYKNDRYLYFGRVAARMDDAVNFLPSRLSGLCMIGASYLLQAAGSPHIRGRAAAHIYRRDRRRHASPNAGQTESVMAGALGIRLAGAAYYFGILHEKPYIGDAKREPEAEDILRAVRLMYLTSVLALLLFCGIKAALS